MILFTISILIIISLYVDIVIVYNLSKVFWQHDHNRRNLIALNIVGGIALIAGLILLPYGGAYLLGVTLFNVLYSLFFTKRLPTNLYYMHFTSPADFILYPASSL